MTDDYEDEQETIAALRKEYEEAHEEELDAASRASLAREQLSDLGVEVGEE